MRLNGIKKFGGAILGLFLFVGIMAVSSTTAQAQYPTWNQDQYRRAERERRERELQRQRQQQQSGYYDQYGNWHSTGSYNNNGYYNNGYNRGRNYDGYGNQGGSYDLRQTALNAGYNEGLKAGRDDRRRGRYNPSHSINSLKDYNSRMGDRSTYQNYFMQAYQNGYADGYRGV
jgi:hypothetical protein